MDKSATKIRVFFALVFFSTIVMAVNFGNWFCASCNPEHGSLDAITQSFIGNTVASKTVRFKPGDLVTINNKSNYSVYRFNPNGLPRWKSIAVGKGEGPVPGDGNSGPSKIIKNPEGIMARVWRWIWGSDNDTSSGNNLNLGFSTNGPGNLGGSGGNAFNGHGFNFSFRFFDKSEW